MLIKRIKLENFKNFDTLDIELSNLNVIVGANSSGKSNFIQAIRFLRDIQRHGIENAISLQGGLDYLRNMKIKGEKRTRISVSFEPEGETILHENPLVLSQYKSLEYSIELASKRGNKYNLVREELAVSTEQRGFSKSLQEIRKVDEGNIMKESNLLSNYDFAIVNSNGKLKIIPNSKKNGFSIVLDNGKQLTIDYDKLRGLILPFDIMKNNIESQKTLIEQFPFQMFDLNDVNIYDFDLKGSKKPSLITAKAELEENGENLAIVIKNILSDSDKTRAFSNYITDILPFITEFGVDKSYNKSVFFKVKEKYNPTSEIPSSLLSDGTISVASIVTALFFEKKKLAVFEEPEQGVHPSLIAKLMQLYYEASEQKQIIITTHNPEIVKHTKLNDLLLINRSDDGFASVSKPIEKEMVKVFLESELGIDHLFVQNLLDS